MGRTALLALVVLACACAVNARTQEAIGHFWTDGSSKPSQQQGGASVAAAAAAAVSAAAAAAQARQPASSSNPGSAGQKAAAARPSSSQAAASGAKPAPSSKPVTAVPRRASRPHADAPSPRAAAAKQGPMPAARTTPLRPRHQPATGSSSAGRPAAAAPVTPQQILPPLSPPTVIRPPLGGGTEPMTRFSKDIRGLQLSIINIKLNPTTLSADGQSITGFTFAGDLQCMAAASMPIVGTCYISADMLADDDQAMATAICVTNTNAPNCDPMLTGSLTITSTGLLTVNKDNVTTSTSSAFKAAATSSPVITSFNTVTPMIVDGVYSSTRPDTLLSSIVGFKRGSLDIPNVKRTDTGSYTGSITLSLFKGPVL